MRGYVDTSVGQLHYAHEGDSGPDVVLFHCYNTTHRLYERALPLLGPRVRAWAFDGPGAGLSDAPSGEATVADTAGWFVEAFEALGIRRPVLGGLHTGARMALQVAEVLGAENIAAVVLTGSGPLVPVTGGGLNAPTLEFATDAEATQWAKAQHRYHVLFPDQSVPTEDDGWLQHLYVLSSMTKYNTKRFNWAGRVPEEWELQSFYQSLDVPVVFLNTPEDCFSPSDRELAPLNPRAQLRMLEGIGPHLMLRAPEVYVRELFAFLEANKILEAAS